MAIWNFKWCKIRVEISMKFHRNINRKFTTLRKTLNDYFWCTWLHPHFPSKNATKTPCSTLDEKADERKYRYIWLALEFDNLSNLASKFVIEITLLRENSRRNWTRQSGNFQSCMRAMRPSTIFQIFLLQRANYTG